MKALLLCGTGVGAGHMTRETREALWRCARVFAVSVPGELLAELKQELPRLTDAASADAAALWRRLRRGAGETGVLFLGHPLLYTAAPGLIARCRAEGVPFRILGSVSILDAVLAELAPSWEGPALEAFGASLSLLNAQDLAGGRCALDRRATSVVLNLFKLSAREWARALARLEKVYGSGHGANLIALGARRRSRAASLKALRALEAPFSSELTLVVPRRA